MTEAVPSGRIRPKADIRPPVSIWANMPQRQDQADWIMKTGPGTEPPSKYYNSTAAVGQSSPIGAGSRRAAEVRELEANWQRDLPEINTTRGNLKVSRLRYTATAINRQIGHRLSMGEVLLTPAMG